MTANLFLFRQLPVAATTAARRVVFDSAAKVQHQTFVEKIQTAASQSDSTSNILQGSSRFSQCVFIGDCVVSLVPGVVVSTVPCPYRYGENTAIHTTLAIESMNGEEWSWHEMSAKQICSASDVLKLGNTVFIGQNDNTNDAAHSFWHSICKKYDLKYCAVATGATSLKAHVSWLGDDVGLVVQDSVEGWKVLSVLLKREKDRIHPEKVYFMENQYDANMLRIYSSIFFRPGSKIFQMQQKNRMLQFHSLDTSRLDPLLSRCVAILEKK